MDILELSSRTIDSGTITEPTNRVTNELTELADGLALVESFSHSAVLDTGDGLVAFDASASMTGSAVVDAIRTWSDAPVVDLVYTHGHADHIGGSFAFAADAEARGHRLPTVRGHERVAARIDRYELTNDWSMLINQRQFGGIPSDMGLTLTEGAARFIPRATLRPDVTFADVHRFAVGDVAIELHHARGETDDHLWAWLPEKRWLFSGDFIIWNYPNAGNPQKVQRYAAEWAAALRRMISQGPELLIPAHGLPIEGRERIATVLDDIATTLESLVEQVIAMMNAGETLDAIIHTVTVPQSVLDKPYLRPYYDEPEFVVRNIWRLNGGWWDGAASRLKPAPDAVLATELSALVGGPEVLIRRATELVETDLRLACHLADLAGWAAPDDRGIHAERAAIYDRRRHAEPSLMSQGIFRSASRASAEVAERPEVG
ncbi:MAG: alkyl sulfatase dimerization domain-containing protein [Actinomycetes bacterium]